MNKVKSLREIKKIAAKLKKKRKKIVFTNGCFDILHYGHIKYLKKCRQLGDFLIVGLNSDASVRKIKGKNRPITPEKQRSAVLAALEFVDFITVFASRTPANLIKEISPDVLAKGGDWQAKDIVGSRHVRKRGGRVVSVPFVKGYSTTRIIRRLKNA